MRDVVGSDKVYHVDMVRKITHRCGSDLERFRIVLTHAGIRRIDEIKPLFITTGDNYRGTTMSTAFTDTERAILRIVQFQLPDTLTPYADIAREVGTDRGRRCCLLRRMKEDGSIRRFGASIKHQKTGWTHNAMVAWIVDEADSDAIGEVAAKEPAHFHVYFRPTSAPDWPYTLYTMVHGRSEDECLQVIEELRRETALDEYAVLDSLEELKKRP